MFTVTLPLWMWERIVKILEEHPYTGAQEIIEAIKEQSRLATAYKHIHFLNRKCENS